MPRLNTVTCRDSRVFFNASLWGETASGRMEGKRNRKLLNNEMKSYGIAFRREGKDEYTCSLSNLVGKSEQSKMFFGKIS